MTLEECKQCKYHYRMKFDDVLCRFSGGFDYQVIANNKKGVPIVVMCPKETVSVQGKNFISTKNLKSILNAS
jgi:hypothetical protein